MPEYDEVKIWKDIGQLNLTMVVVVETCYNDNDIVDAGICGWKLYI